VAVEEQVESAGRLSVDDAMDELRQAMYEEGTGTWFTARITID
jgi:hypothetical protein